jgi:hypothetical protein
MYTPADRPTLSLKLYLTNEAYAKEEIVAGLERAIETIKKFGLVDTDRIRDSTGSVLGSYRLYKVGA